MRKVRVYINNISGTSLIVAIICILSFEIIYTLTNPLLENRPLPISRIMILFLLVLAIIMLFGTPLTVLLMGRYVTGVRAVYWLLLSLAFGVSFIQLLSYALILAGLLNFYIISLLTIIMLIICAIILAKIFKQKKIEFKKTLINKGSLLLLAVSVYIAFHFIRLCFFINIVPVGDAISHATIVALTLYHNGMPNFEPIYKIPLPVPYRGFHALASFLTSIMRIYPVHSLVVIASVTSALIALFMVTFAYGETQNKLITFLVFLLVLMVPRAKLIPPWTSNDLTLSNLYNGTYPQHLSNFLILASIVTSHILFKSLRRDLTSHIRYLILVTFLLFSAFLANPTNLGISALLLLSSCILMYWKKARKALFIFIVFIVLLAYIFSMFIGPYLITAYRINIYTYYLTSYYVFSTRIVYTLLIMLSIAVLMLKLRIKRYLTPVDLFLLFLAAFLMLSYNKYIYSKLLWILFPTRVYLLLYATAVLSLALNLRVILCNIKAHKHVDRLLALISLTILLLSNFNGVLYNMTFTPSDWDRAVGCNYDAILFLLNVSDTHDLILNDPNWIGMLIPGFRPQRVIFERTLLFYFHSTGNYSNTFVKRANHILRALLNQYRNYDDLARVLRQYNISYIFLSSSKDYFNFSSKSYGYKIKGKYSKYLNEFDRNPYLETIFKCNNVRVYKVVYNRKS